MKRIIQCCLLLTLVIAVINPCTAATTCPKCGKHYHANSGFCTSDGTKLTQTSSKGAPKATPRAPRYKCSMCGKLFQSNTALRTHQKRHSTRKVYPKRSSKSGDKPGVSIKQEAAPETLVSCPWCRKNFNGRDIQSHMSMCEDKYICPVCQKRLDKNNVEFGGHMYEHGWSSKQAMEHMGKSYQPANP